LHVTALVAWASLPLSRWTRHLHRNPLPSALQTGICPITTQSSNVSIRGIVTKLIVVVCGFCCCNRRRSPATWPSCPANLALAVLPALRWRPCPRHAGVLASIELLLLPALRWRCCPCCAGLFALITLALPSALQLASAQPQRSHNTSVCVALLLWSSSLPVASLPYLALFYGDLALDGPANAALASLPALCWHPFPHCAGLITNITLSPLPALRWCHCHHRVGAFAVIVLALLPLLPSCHHQHRKLASAQSQSSCNTCWHHCQHCAVVFAGVAPA
jgi:hypothetical protein